MSVRFVAGSTPKQELRHVTLLQKPNGVEILVDNTAIAFLQNNETLMVFEERGGRYLFDVVLAGLNLRKTLHCFQKVR